MSSPFEFDSFNLFLMHTHTHTRLFQVEDAETILEATFTLRVLPGAPSAILPKDRKEVLHVFVI